MVMARREVVEHAMPYFRELVESALTRQRLTTTEEAAFYIVHLLASFLKRSADEESGPLAVRLAQALGTDGVRQRAGLKAIGDESLFVSGFFAESLQRGVVDVGYYVAIGGAAYDVLARQESDASSPVFAELARKFVGFVDVLAEVSSRTSCASNVDLLRLYEKWLKTGSPRSAQLLAEKGVVPSPGGNSNLKH
jgi:hypothetical protein